MPKYLTLLILIKWRKQIIIINMETIPKSNLFFLLEPKSNLRYSKIILKYYKIFSFHLEISIINENLFISPSDAEVKFEGSQS